MGIPIIGITTYNDLNLQGYPAVILLKAYENAIIKARGIPVLIPSGLPDDAWRELFEKLDGIMFTGGGDISITNYDGIDHPSITNVDTERDHLEIMLMNEAIRKEKPFFGICRGFQLLNVCLGGTLYTHIPAQKTDSIKHDYYPDYPRKFLAHKVEISSGSRLSTILGREEADVNSLHHQGVNSVPEELNIVALAPDGLVEAVELPGHKFGMAVQWHPEWLTDIGSMQNLFSALIQAARTGN
jgi:putative glutamine amidotransferase